MKPLNIAILIAIAILISYLISFFSGNSDIQKINPEEAKVNLEKNSEIILLDVRTPEEYKQRNIPGSILIPLGELEDRIENEIVDKEKTIYVYCRTGNRSLTAVKIMNKLGYSNVFDLGGINSWPYETVSQ